MLGVLVCLPAGVFAADPALDALEEQAFKQAAALVGPSVVRIQTVGGLDRVGEMLAGTGPTTGVIVSDDGYIISSSFNFAAKPATILVTFPNEQQPVPAKVVASDRSKMLTLLKVEGRGSLVPAPAAPKDSIRVGQWAIALGRAYDVDVPSVSVGIVSALGRIWGKAIQTDAKISPVNYGGPLVDVEGRVMGILVPLSPQGTGEAAGVEWYDGGIGFAIPLEDIYGALDRLKAGEDLHPGLMGISFKGDGGVLAGEPVIDRVRVDSPAEEAGFKPGDVIVQIDGDKVTRQAGVRHALGDRYAGDTIAVTVKRGEETITKELTLVEKLLAFEAGFLGVLPVRRAVDAEPQAGVTVRHVFADSPAAKAGLEARDRILKFGDKDVADAGGLADLVSRLRPGEKATLVYARGEEEKSAEVELASVPNNVPADLLTSPIPAAAEGAELPKTGRFDLEVPGHEQQCWAYVPGDYNPDHRYGLVVWVHPKGDSMEAGMLDAWRALCQERGLILAAPRAADLVGGWTPNDTEFVKDTVVRVRELYSIDPARIVIHGYADSSDFAVQLAFKYREQFRAVAVASGALRSEPDENRPESRLQFYLAVGEKDPQRGALQAAANGLRGMKYPVVLNVIPDWEHKYPGGEVVREVGRWVDVLDRI
ncbi:MAG TPA: PDZ domain-containing protein [Planctomycetaceae bacterium]|nr:PDZ domain-containing protein [Planctomycetaceae bacterium]